MTEQEIADIKDRLERATPGPWTSFVESIDQYSGSDFIQTADDDINFVGIKAADQDFIAHARQDVPRLLVEVERLKRLLNDRVSEN